MNRQFLLGITLLAFTTVCSAQSLSVSATAGSSGNNSSTFDLKEGKISFSNGGLQFQASGTMLSGYLALGISPDLAVVGAVEGSGSSSRISLLNSEGKSLSTFEISAISPGDPSVAIYPSGNGEVLVRDNIVNFTFYDTFGEIITNLSGSSQSEGGESISEVATDASSETVIIYTPKIKNSGSLGSQAAYVDESLQLQSLYYSTGRYIKYLDVSNNGQFVVFITSNDDGDDHLHVTDRFGNELAEIAAGENLNAASLSSDTGTVTAVAGNRILVFDLMSGDRLGSTSFRSEVVTAGFFPKDQVIVALTGNRSGDSGSIRGAQFHAINIEERKVERSDYRSALGYTESLPLQFRRTAANRYLLEGTSKKLELRVAF